MAVTVEVKNGTLDLFTSGVFLLKGNEPTTLLLKEDPEQIGIVLKFENSEKDLSLINKIAKSIDNTTLEILFINYNQPLGNYTKDFWEIGTFKKRRLYLTYGIFGMTDGNLKKFDYSFYLGEEVPNG